MIHGLDALAALRFLAVCRRRRRILEQRSRMRARLQRLKRLPALTWEQFMRKPALDPKRGGEAMFKKLFRMSREQFKHVQSLLEGEKEKDARRKRANGKRMGTPEKCEPPIALAMTLRFLAGGAVADIMLVYDVAESTFYDTLKRTLERLYHALPDWQLVEALDARSEAPTPDARRLEVMRADFSSKGLGYMTGVIGAIDGLLIPVEAQNDRDNARDFYCRKGFHAINVQAIADTHGRFIYAEVGSVPGCAHDSWAWAQDPMSGYMRDTTHPIGKYLIEHGLHLIGDDAYSCSDTLATPFPGNFERTDTRWSYNKTHSSLRQAIERAFGMLCRKWLILKRTFPRDLRRTKQSAGLHILVVVCMKLHNLSIKTGPTTEQPKETDVYESDVTGTRDPMAEGTCQPRRWPRVDHLGRAQALDPSITHLTSPNPELAAAEAAAGNKKEAAWAACHACIPDASWKDALWDARALSCVPRANAEAAMRHAQFQAQ